MRLDRPGHRGMLESITTGTTCEGWFRETTKEVKSESSHEGIPGLRLLYILSTIIQ